MFFVRMHSSSGARLTAFPWLPQQWALFVGLILVPGSSIPSVPYRHVLGDPVVFRCVWIMLVKLLEFPQAVY